jgi:hypothetical protein
MKKVHTTGGFFLIWVLASLIGCGGGGDAPGILFPTPSPVTSRTVTISGTLDYKENGATVSDITLIASSTPEYSPASELFRPLLPLRPLAALPGHPLS